MGAGRMPRETGWKSEGHTDRVVREALTGSQEDALTGGSGIH